MSEPYVVGAQADLNTDPLRSSPGRLTRILVLIAIAGFVVLVFAIVLQFASRSLQITRETTYITEPRKSNGRQVDYFAAIEGEVYPANLATEENGYRLMLERVGAVPAIVPWQFEQACRKLGLDPSRVRPDLKYEDPHDFIATYLHDPDNGEAVAAIVALLAEKAETSEVAEGQAATGRLEPQNPPAADTAESAFLAEEVAEDDQIDLHAIQDLLKKRVGEAPWKLEDLPMMARWLQDNGPALDLIRKAVHKPVFHIPMVRASEQDLLIMLTLNGVQWTRSFALGLAARANCRIGSGDIDRAIDDIIACKRLGRHIGHGTTIIELLVGVAIEGIADSIGPAGSLTHPPTGEQLQRLLDSLDDMPPPAEFKPKMKHERYAALDLLQVLGFGGEGAKSAEKYFGARDGVPRVTGAIGLDWNLIARRVNAHYDAMIDEGAEPPWPRPHPIQLVSRSARSILVADAFATQLLPPLTAADAAVHRARCGENMRRVTLAMLLYERDHGTLPPAYTADEYGKPLQSWRVLLLPYLGRQDLYEQLRLDEPWDSPHNRAFHTTNVSCYQCPTTELAQGQTNYSVVIGEKTAFGSDGQGRRLDSLGPRSGDMILVVDRMVAVCWMNPSGEMSLEQALAEINTASGIGSDHPGSGNVALLSGAVKFFTDTIDVNITLRGLLEGTLDELP